MSKWIGMTTAPAVRVGKKGVALYSPEDTTFTQRRRSDSLERRASCS